MPPNFGGIFPKSERKNKGNNLIQFIIMCVIIAKPRYIKNPSTEILRAAMVANPDGFAIAWPKNGKLEVFRTLSAREMEKYYITNYNELQNNGFVFHARFATHGTQILSNCHGWRTVGGKAFFHNGVLNIKNRDNMTDSETFLRDIYEPIAKAGGDTTAAINCIIGGSKFAFIDANGEIELYGHYINKCGINFSNLNFTWRYEERKHPKTYYYDFYR